MLLLGALSTLCGERLARCFAWQDARMAASLSLPLGAALAPFLLGLAVVLALQMSGPASTSVILAWVVIILLAIALLAHASTWQGRPPIPPIHAWQSLPKASHGVWAPLLLLLCVADLCFLAYAMPLVENDALEYGLVARAIHEAGSLSVYPLVDPAQAKSGFFAPWTHPPLYVTLLYLCFALQGNGLDTVVLKSIAPWFLLTATWGVAAMARLHSVAAGHIAALLMLSTPLLVLGAQSAAIDSLPVSGSVLIMMALVGADRGRLVSALQLGTIAGVAMWTHSQAILFVPILGALVLFTAGRAGAGHTLLYAAAAVAAMLLMAAYPYVRNFQLYGTPISDNPAVFALKSLDWDGFFKYTRSIYDGATRIQYGLFKGLLAVHSFGAVFWFAALGAIGLAVTGLLWQPLRGVGVWTFVPARQKVLLASGAFLAIYGGGILASMLVGTDLMIKNDRYLLVAVPAAALFAGYALTETRKHLQSSLSGRAFRWLAACMIFGHVGTFLLYANLLQLQKLVDVKWPLANTARAQLQREAQPIDIQSPAASPEEPEGRLWQWPRITLRSDPLASWANITLAKDLAEQMHPDAKVLALRPADMFYASRRMVSYLDPSLVTVYGEHDPRKFASRLRRLGITHVQVPDYWIPPIPNSALMRMLADPALAALVRDESFQQLYKLLDADADVPLQVQWQDIPLGALDWIEYPKVGIGGPTFRVPGAAHAIGGLPYSAHSDNPLLAKSYSHMVEPRSAVLTVKPGSEYLLRMKVRGEGFVRIWAWWFRQDDSLGEEPDDRAHLVGDFVLSPQIDALQFERRMRIASNVTHVRFGIERYGMSSLTLDSVELAERIQPDVAARP